MNFDFRIIEKEYPKAFALLGRWFVIKTDCFLKLDEDGSLLVFADEQDELPNIFNPLELDFFFDEQGAHGTIGCFVRKKNDYYWGYDIETDFPPYPPGFSDEFNSRAEALTALWLKEFSILESQQEGSEGK